MKKYLLCILSFTFLIQIQKGICQDYEFKEWSEADKIKANTAKNVKYFSDEEKKLIFLLNLMRINPTLFAETYVARFVKDSKMKITDDIKSLNTDLKASKSLKLFQPSENLTKASKFHAKDMGNKGKIGHNSSDGTNVFKRIKKYAKGNSMAENCSYGFDNNKALAIIMQLLIDEGVENHGHRKNFLNDMYNYIGISIYAHKKYGFNCVIDFSDRGD
jgi:uncharacterized protein YkwD